MNRYVLVLSLLLVSLPANTTELTVMGGYQFNNDFEISTINDPLPQPTPQIGNPGDDVELDDGSAGSLALDFVFRNNPNQRIGLWVSYQNTDFGDNAGLSNTEMDVTHLHFTALNYYPDGKMEPFVLAGVGAGIFSPQDSSLEDETKFSAQIGGGTNYRFTEHLLLRLDVRWIATFFNSSGAAFCSGGCAIQLSSDTYSQIQTSVGLMYRF